MSILTLGSWVTKTAGRLFSSGLGLNRPSSSRINLTQPVPHGSLLEERVPQAKADFQVRSYSKLRLLHQKASSLSIGLDCLSNEAKQRKKEHDCSHSVVHRSDSGNDMLALPPLSFYLLHFICPVNERALDNNATLEPEMPQPAGGWLAGISVPAVNSMTRAAAVYLDQAGILTLITRTRAGIVSFFTMTRARIETFFNMARARMVTVFSIERARIAAGFPETREEMEGFFPSNYELEPVEETLIPLASLNRQIQCRQQLHALSSVCSGVFYWRVSGSRMPRPPHLSATPSASVVNDIQQRSTDRLILPLHGMHRPIGHQNAPKSNLSALMQAGKNVVFTMTRAVYGMTRKAASSLYGMAWTLSAKLYRNARAVSAEVPGVVRILIVKPYRLVQAAFDTLVRTWKIVFIMTLVCLETLLIHMIWGIMADCRFDISLSLVPVIIMPLIIDITLSRGLEIYRNFTMMLDGILPDWTVHKVAAALTTLQIINRAQLFAFIVVCPLSALIGIERYYEFLSDTSDYTF